VALEASLSMFCGYFISVVGDSLGEKALKDAGLSYSDVQQACIGYCYGECLYKCFLKYFGSFIDNKFFIVLHAFKCISK